MFILLLLIKYIVAFHYQLIGFLFDYFLFVWGLLGLALFVSFWDGIDGFSNNKKLIISYGGALIL